MSEVTHEVTVHDDPGSSRYEAFLDGRLAGFAEYRLSGEDRIVFVHTVVDDAFEGHGVGSTLVREALDDVRRRGTRKVVARCPFVRSWLERHPDQQDVLVSPLGGDE
jgi:predicted GNAT family acetyltransferase